MKKILSILFLLGITVSSFATNYYFAAAGNDANVGSQASPFQTITKLNSLALVAGDNVYFNRGDVFFGALIITHSGVLGNTITYGAYGTGPNPVVTGLFTLTGFTNTSGNLWQSSATTSAVNPQTVIINGVQYSMGRTPNTGYYTYSSSTATSLTSSSLNAATTDWTGATAVVRKNNWVTDRCPITSAATTTINYTNPSAYNGIANYGFFLENDIRTVDTTNEWFYDATAKKLTVYSVGAPTNVQMSSIDTLVNVNQNDYLTFDHIDFTGSNKMCFLATGTKKLTIQYCNFNYHGRDVIWGISAFGAASCDSLTLQFDSAHNVNNDFFLGTSDYSNAQIHDNYLHNIGMFEGMMQDGSGNYPNAVALYVEGGSQIYNNKTDSTGYNGIMFFASNVNVKHNEVMHFCAKKMDGGGIYTWFGPTTRSNRVNQIVDSNVVHDDLAAILGTTETKPLAHGIYLDDGTSAVNAYGNNIFNVSYSGMYLHNDSAINVHNNNVYNCNFTQLLMTNYTSAHPNRNSFVKNNIFTSTGTQYVLNMQSYSDSSDIKLWGTIDSNVTARPIDDNIDIQVIINGFGTYLNYILSQWQAYTNFDTHSTKSPATISTAGNLIFKYNASLNAGVVQLGAKYIDMKNVAYNSAITLQPFTSSTLIYSSPTVVTNTINYPAWITIWK